MSLTTGEMSAADLAAVVGSNGNGNNWGGLGDSGWWIILLFLIFGNGGWGGNGGSVGGNGGVGGLYPWMNQAEITQDGFRDQMLNTNVMSIRDGISNLSTQLCNCCSDMQSTVSNGFAQAEIADNARQIANMQQSFANQMATAQGFNGISSQLADCCCENRLAVANLGADIAREACADRAAVTDGVRDIIASQTAGFQSIKDQLCQDKIDAKNERIADLERQLTMANLAASQTAQTARLERSNSEVIDGLYNRLATCPVGTMPVYGNQPIFTCPNNSGCGCGCGVG